MEREKKVVDASVIFKLFSNERESEKALELKNKHIKEEILIVVPELVFLEVANALIYKKKNEEVIAKINKDLWDLQFQVEKLNNSLMDKAIQISLKNNITIYDSLYISIAQIYGCQLITADSSLYKISNVAPLGNV